jgi:hypothetical protein
MELQGELAYPLQREVSLRLLHLLHQHRRCQQLAKLHRLQLLLHPE